jgi:hypothetical protein
MDEEAKTCPPGPQAMGQAMSYLGEVQVCNRFAKPVNSTVWKIWPNCFTNCEKSLLTLAKWVQKRLLPERDEVYQQFLKLFSDFVGGGTSVDEILSRIKVLFKDEPDLVEGLEKFVPVNYQKIVEAEVTKKEPSSV